MDRRRLTEFKESSRIGGSSPDATADEILAQYLDEVPRAREIAAASFDDVAADPRANGRTLRWIMVHMLEEYARHLGHVDIMREAIDGATGD